MINKIKASIRERMRHAVKQAEFHDFRRKLGTPNHVETSGGVLQSLLSIKPHLAETIPLIIDIGAHLGHFSKPAALAFGAEKVVCYEPNQQLHGELKQNLSGINSDIVSAAIGLNTGMAEFFVHKDPSMSSLSDSDPALLKTHFATYDTEDIETQSVEVRTLEEEYARLGNPQWRFLLKVDTQGTDLEAVQSGGKALENCVGIVVEYMFLTPYANSIQFLPFIEGFSKLGFECKGALEIMRKSTGMVSGVDFLFVPKSN